jgi:hypothetical protein
MNCCSMPTTVSISACRESMALLAMVLLTTERTAGQESPELAAAGAA